MNRILIFGNSGSGKSTFANQLAAEYSLPYLDLDIITFDSPGLRKSFIDSKNDLLAFIKMNKYWIIEGCYGSLIQEASVFCTELFFLNPGIDICKNNNSKRPWEPHKYKSIADQNKNLDMLQNWVSEYESRDDEYSFNYHRSIFDNFSGNKKEFNSLSEYRI